MPFRFWFRLAELLVPILLAITIYVSWQADRRDRAQLASQLAAAQQTIAQATANQKDRDAQLTQTLAQLAAQKQSAITPDQILKVLPQALSLPSPITLQSSNPAGNYFVGARVTAPSREGPAGGTAQATNLPTNPTPKSLNASAAILPSADLKPLYDFALDCKACQDKLTAARADLSDEKVKSAALAKERDAAIRAAKGGSALRRIARAAKWFVLGAAAGAIAAKAHH